MLRAVEELAHEFVGERRGPLLALDDGADRLLLVLGEFLLGEGGVQRGVAEQLDELGQIFDQAGGDEAGTVLPAAALDTGAEEVGHLGKFERAVVCRAAVEQRGGGVGHADVFAVGGVAGFDEQPQRDGGRAVVLDHVDAQAVGQDARLVRREAGGGRGAGRGGLRAVDLRKGRRQQAEGRSPEAEKGQCHVRCHGAVGRKGWGDHAGLFASGLLPSAFICRPSARDSGECPSGRRRGTCWPRAGGPRG